MSPHPSLRIRTPPADEENGNADIQEMEDEKCRRKSIVLCCMASALQTMNYLLSYNAFYLVTAILTCGASVRLCKKRKRRNPFIEPAEELPV
jgi:hypothetical protein